jgi:hypothetical protein
MAATKKILTSIHGRRLGLSADKKLVVDGKVAAASIDEGALILQQGAPGALNATGTLTAALIAAGIVTSTSAAAVAATLSTGALLDTAFPEIAIGEAFEWSLINTGPNTVTVTASAGHTIVGTATVATVTSGYFMTRRTAANTWITYRMS